MRVIVKKVIRCVVAFAFIVGELASCSLIDVHPYDGKVDGATNLTQRNISAIEHALTDRDTIRFAVISDTQRWYDEMEDEVSSINHWGNVDFVIHCGDQTDFGATKEFEWQRRILDKLQMPYVVVIGNHDCIGSGKAVYRTMYGKENFSFCAASTRFICLDTNALEYDFSSSVPDFKFIRSFAGDSTVRNTIVVMHAKPFSDEFDDNLTDAFNYYIHQLTNPLFCLCGHEHNTEVVDVYGDGLLYYEITCAKKRQYYVFTLTKEGDYECEVVNF